MGIWMAKVPRDHVSRNRNVFVLVLSRAVELDILNIMYFMFVEKKVVYVDYLNCDIYVNVGEFSGFDISFVECWNLKKIKRKFWKMTVSGGKMNLILIYLVENNLLSDRDDKKIWQGLPELHVI